MNQNEINHDLRISDHLVGLIDILFAVVVGSSFTKLVLTEEIIKSPSFEDIITVPNVAFFIAYYAVILSWIGYHSMIEDFPYKYKSLSGIFRFMEDVLIVFVYIITIYSRKNLLLFLILFMSIFILYTVNDCIRAKEHKNYDKQKIKSFTFSIFFGINLILYYILNYVYPISNASYIALILTFLLVTYYRFGSMIESKYMLRTKKTNML